MLNSAIPKSGRISLSNNNDIAMFVSYYVFIRHQKDWEPVQGTLIWELIIHKHVQKCF